MCKSNRVVDLFAAFLAGAFLTWIDVSTYFQPSIFQLTSAELTHRVLHASAIRIGTFMAIAAALAVLTSRMRAGWGWIGIAVLGTLLVSGIDEIIYDSSATAAELEFMPAFSPFPLEFLLYVLPVLMIMGLVHYTGGWFWGRAGN